MAAQPPTEQCSAMTQRDTPCKRLISREGIIPYPNTRIPVPLFCHDHLKSNLVEQRFRCIKYPDVFIIYNAYIPSYLEPHTKVLLRQEMRKRPTRNDLAGYLYVPDFQDTTNQDLVHFKVGRTNTLNRRLAQHNNKCGSSFPVLLDFYPSPNAPNDATNDATPDASDDPAPGAAAHSEPDLALSMIRPGDKVPHSHTLERLVHLELADIAANSHPALGVVPGERLGVNAPRRPCVDCGTSHEEIFTFRRLLRTSRGREYEEIVKPVVEKWGAYVFLGYFADASLKREKRLPGQYWLDMPMEPPKHLSDVVKYLIGALYVSDNFFEMGVGRFVETVFKPFLEAHVRLQMLSANPKITLLGLLQAEGCQNNAVIKRPNASQRVADAPTCMRPATVHTSMERQNRSYTNEQVGNCLVN